MHRPSSGSLSLSPRTLLSRPGTASSATTTVVGSSRPPTGRDHTFKLTDPRIERMHRQQHRSPHYQPSKRVPPRPGDAFAEKMDNSSDIDFSGVELDLQRVLELLRQHREAGGDGVSGSETSPGFCSSSDQSGVEWKSAEKKQQQIRPPLPPSRPYSSAVKHEAGLGETSGGIENKSWFPSPQRPPGSHDYTRHDPQHQPQYPRRADEGDDWRVDIHASLDSKRRVLRSASYQRDKDVPTSSSMNRCDGSEGLLRESAPEDKKAFIARLNAVIAVNTGFVETKRTIAVSMPLFQALHPLDYVCKAATTELPNELRMTATRPIHSTSSPFKDCGDNNKKSHNTSTRKIDRPATANDAAVAVKLSSTAAPVPSLKNDPSDGRNHRVTITEGRKVLIPPVHNACPLVEGSFVCTQADLKSRLSSELSSLTAKQTQEF